MSEQELLLSKYINLGARVEIEAIERVLQADGTYTTKKYESKVVDILDEDRLEILMPLEHTKLVLLPVNGEYELHFFSGKGLFQCLARVSERYKSGNLYLLEMELISDLQKYQRREYYRYACNMELGVRSLSDEEKRLLALGRPFAPEELPFLPATVADISGGGIRFVSKTPFEDDEAIVCTYTLTRNNETKKYVQLARKLSCKKNESDNTLFEHRVQFLFINNMHREEIIRFIFEEERKKEKRRKM